MFWYLHHLRKDSIAARITDHLRANIDTGNLSAEASKKRKGLKEAFVNDIKELQEDGKMRPLLLTAGARLIGSYSSLVKDLTGDNVIVVKIREAAKRAAIDDSSVPNHTKVHGGIQF